MSIYECSITNPKKQLEFYKDLSEQLQVKNNQLNKQLEESDFKIANLTMDKIELNKQLEKNNNSNLSRKLETVKKIAHEWEASCIKLENQQKEFIEYLENEIYSIEPKGTGINYNCEYDSEEDYISAMKEQSKLNTFKEILSKYKEIIGVSDENN